MLSRHFEGEKKHLNHCNAGPKKSGSKKYPLGKTKWKCD